MQIKAKSQLPAELLKLAPKLSKSQILKFYLESTPTPDPKVIELLKKKPIRTLSGVTPVTVLTKPFPCPGECIFCPVDVRMPKSYIASEPGAQRAGQYGFDPYLQVYNRLQAYQEIGHPVSKVELIVLGGTWSVYPETYQLWFIKRLFEALNDFSLKQDHRTEINRINLQDHILRNESYNQHITKTEYLQSNHSIETWETLEAAQNQNETSLCRCVGLVLETRPDYVTQTEILRLRRLGATKIQIGIQSLNDQVLTLNKRGHSVKQTKDAINLLRQAGFKIHAHWMPNLYGSNVKADILDYNRLFSDPDICPDELKVYPCSLIENTELMTIYNQGLWHPYTKDELAQVLSYVLTHTPEYCRLTRIIRDIPGPEIVTGNKTTNFRQLLEKLIDPKDMHDIRAREVKHEPIDPKNLFIDDLIYETGVSTEHFLQYVNQDRKIAAFLRLSLPKVNNLIPELDKRAIIREVHVYGESLNVGSTSKGLTQHQGLGKSLIKTAEKMASDKNYLGISVISAVGTREYYRKLGFKPGDLYQHLDF